MKTGNSKYRFSLPKPGELLFTIMAVLIGVTIGYLLNDNTSSEAMHYEIRTRGYDYINPLLDCELAEDADENREPHIIGEKVKEIIDDRLARGLIMNASIYFRDLNNGPWFSTKPDETFSPASLLKVPLMISVLKRAETDPELLGRKIRFSGFADHNEIQNIKPDKKLVPGAVYTIDELLHNMIVYSDNNASALIEDFFEASILKDVYRVVGLTWPSDGQKHEMSVESYARFFRILFNASYLNREMSEKALGYIAEVDLRDGLVEAVPRDIRVAHKFGELINAADGARQLHECGIVYYPNHPYLLCMMTKGHSFEDLDKTINKVSHVVYDSIANNIENGDYIISYNSIGGRG
jgi:beta-lactamase class A